MLKLTKKADYALIALKHLTVVRPRSASAKEISERFHIPVPVLSKVLQRLTKHGFLASVHGTNGGYRLAQDPDRISALQIVRAIDGPVFLASCFTENGKDCNHLDHCSIRDPLRRVHEGILGLLEAMTMLDLAADPPAAIPHPGEAPTHLTILN
ncbi:MAG: Rrf2 family transcriptional regulator [Acidobacteria bacterium]|nr:Rrf2 family transcriptional regulator [Acidobacteriota bacterium]